MANEGSGEVPEDFDFDSALSAFEDMQDSSHLDEGQSSGQVGEQNLSLNPHVPPHGSVKGGVSFKGQHSRLTYDEWIEWAINGEASEEEAAASNKPKKKESLRLRKQRTKPFVYSFFGGEDPTFHGETRKISLENLIAVMRTEGASGPRLSELTDEQKDTYMKKRRKLQKALLDCWSDDELDKIFNGAKATNEGGGQKPPSEIQQSR